GDEAITLFPVETMDILTFSYHSAEVYYANDAWQVDADKPPDHNMEKIKHPSIAYYQEELYKKWEQQQHDIKDVQSDFHRLVTEVNRERERGESKQAKDVWHAIKSYIDQHYHEMIHFHSLIQSFGMNSATFYKMFKEDTGYTPLQYVTKKRIDQAKELLTSTTLRIADIAEQVGYPDAYYFSRVFKREVGVPPQRFSQICTKKFCVLSSVAAVNLLALGIDQQKK